MGNRLSAEDVQLWSDRLNLPLRCTEVCILRFVDNLSQEAIALLMGITHPVVCAHLKRARRQYPNLPRLLTHGRHRVRGSNALAIVT